MSLALHGLPIPTGLASFSESTSALAVCLSSTSTVMVDGDGNMDFSTAFSENLQAVLSLPFVLRGALSVTSILSPRVVIDAADAEHVASFAGRLSSVPVGVDDSLLTRRSSFTGRTITLRRSRDTFVPAALQQVAYGSSVASQPAVEFLPAALGAAVSEVTGAAHDDPDSWFSPAFFSGITSYLGFGATTFADLELHGSSAWQRASLHRWQATPSQLCGMPALVAAWELDESEAALMIPISTRRAIVSLLQGTDATASFSDLLLSSPASLARAPAPARLPLLHAALWARRRVERESQLRTMQATNASRCDPLRRPIFGHDLRNAVSIATVAGFTAMPLDQWHDLEEDGEHAAALDSLDDGSVGEVDPMHSDAVNAGPQRKSADTLFGSPSDRLGRERLEWRKGHAASFRGGLCSPGSLARPSEVVLVSSLAAAPGALQPCKMWSSAPSKKQQPSQSGSWACFSDVLRGCVRSYDERLASVLPTMRRFTFAIPKAQAASVKLTTAGVGVVDTTLLPGVARTGEYSCIFGALLTVTAWSVMTLLHSVCAPQKRFGTPETPCPHCTTPVFVSNCHFQIGASCNSTAASCRRSTSCCATVKLALIAASFLLR